MQIRVIEDGRLDPEEVVLYGRAIDKEKALQIAICASSNCVKLPLYEAWPKLYKDYLYEFLKSGEALVCVTVVGGKTYADLIVGYASNVSVQTIINAASIVQNRNNISATKYYIVQVLKD